MPPLFSIIIPTYNYAEYLPRALDSIFVQTAGDYEIVVVDDGSTDSTAEVIRAYQAKAACPLTYVFQKNQGPSAARNHGVRVSTAPFLLFLDADDALLPGALDRFRSIIAYRVDLDFIAGDRIYVTGDGRRRRRSKPCRADKDRNFRRYLRGQLGRLRVQSLVVHRACLTVSSSPTPYAMERMMCTPLTSWRCTTARHSPSRWSRSTDTPILSHDVNVVRQDRPKAVELLFDPAILLSTRLAR